MAFPRVAAMAEVLWSPKEVRNWSDFSRRIQLMMHRYDLMGINYSKSAFKVTAKSKIDPAKKELKVNLFSELAGVEIHYTTDGSEPTNLSPVYADAILLNKTSTIKAITFTSSSPDLKPFVQSFSINEATAKPVKYGIPCSKDFSGSGEYTLVNGIRGSINHADGEWQAWAGDNMDVVIDLQHSATIHRISVGSIQNVGSWIFFPKKVEFFTSEDGLKYQKVAESINEIDPLSREIQLKDFAAEFNPASARFVKVSATNLGKCPKGHDGAGQAAWLFVDEISVE